MVSLTRFALTAHNSPEPLEPGAVGGEKVGAAPSVAVASGVDVGSASVWRGVAVACASCVSCAATVIATAVAIVSGSTSAPPQEVTNKANSMRMDRKFTFRFLFILCPFGKDKDLPAAYYTALRLENTHEKRPVICRALMGFENSLGINGDGHRCTVVTFITFRNSIASVGAGFSYN